MDRESTDYFKRRAEEEQSAADHAADERAAQSHRDLSNEYRKLANGETEPFDPDCEPKGSGTVSSDFRIVP